VDQPSRFIAKYEFTSPGAAQVWADAVAGSGDPMFHFIASLAHVCEFAKFVPRELSDQLIRLFTAPDLDLLHGFMQVAAGRGQEVARPAVLAVLALIRDAGLLAPWFRAVFGIEIRLLRSSQTIFRGNSAASISSGVFMVALGREFSEMAADILLRNEENIDSGIRMFIEAVSKMPPAIRIIFSACFRATRRKAKEGLLPLIAVSSFLMLRFLLPQFAMISPAACRLGQKLMSIFVFQQSSSDRIGDDIPKLIGDVLLEITNVEPADVPLPPGDNAELFEFCAANAMLLVNKVERAKEGEHLLHWSVLELLETAVFATRKDATDYTSFGDSRSVRENAGEVCATVSRLPANHELLDRG
jgi:hypothetical protein